MEKSCLWSVLWLIVLLLFGWNLGVFFGALYGFVSPLTTCCGLEKLDDQLLKGAKLGKTCVQNMKEGAPLC